MTTVCVAADASYRDRLQPLPDDTAVTWFDTYEELQQTVAQAEVLLLGPDHGWNLEPVLASASSLRWVHTRAAGIDRTLLQTMRSHGDRGITVTNGSGISSTPIAEYVAMVILAVAKELPLLLSQRDRGDWRKPSGTRELLGSRALLLGFGNVGRAVWHRLRAFGVEATAVRRRPEPEDGIEVIGTAEWRARLGEFDWVVVTTPLTDETRHVIAAPELSAMKPDAWLVNVSRGAVVDQAALTKAVREQLVGGVVLDVTDPEPLPADDELWTLPNAIVTPHCSWLSPEFAARASQLFLENLRRWCAGEPLHNVVDIGAGY